MKDSTGFIVKQDGNPLTVMNDIKTTNGDLIIPGHFVYTPNPDGSGVAYDSFAYRLVNDDGMESAEGIVTFNVAVVDDLAISGNEAIDIKEDSGPQLISLSGTDKEGDFLSFTITKLPEKGDLYVDASLNASSKVERVYQRARFIDPIEQPVWDVNAVSSFWGGPPYSGYHALNVIGAPQCARTGFDRECADQRAMFEKDDVGTFRFQLTESAVGELVKVKRSTGYAGAIGKIVGVDGAMGTADVSVFVMQKTVNSSIVDCIMAKAGASYPDDCEPELAFEPPRRSCNGQKV